MGQASSSNGYIADSGLTVPRVFARRVPVILEGFAGRSTALINTFHQEFDTQARECGSGMAGLRFLQQQVRVYDGVFKDHVAAAHAQMNTMQRNINRSVVPFVQAALGPGYRACSKERGKQNPRHVVLLQDAAAYPLQVRRVSSE